MVAEFCLNSKIVSSDFPVMKNICCFNCFKSGFSNSICLLESIAISL